MDDTLSDLTIQAAARWYARLQAPDCSAADRTEFRLWCAERPAHAAAYALARDVGASLTSLLDALLERERDELGRRIAADRQHDVLLAVEHVGHRLAARGARQR